MSKLVFLLEEPSMAEALHGVLPRLLPATIEWQCVPHSGKSDLEASIPRKLRGWREAGVRFVVLRDNDGADCHVRKKRLRELCAEGKREDTLVRIVCQELESWFLGDLKAIDAAGLGRGKYASLQMKAKFRNPDRLGSPSIEIARLIPEYQKISGARAISPYLSLKENYSKSFQVFIAGIQRIISEIPE